MPYLWQAAQVAHETNLPMMRAMFLEFPDDPTCRGLDRQYMLGDSLLVAPVFHDKKAEYYLPPGKWTHLLTGEVRAGGSWSFDEQSFFEMPIWIREGAVVPLGTVNDKAEYDHRENVRLVCGAPSSGEVAETVRLGAHSFDVKASSNNLSVTSSDGKGAFEIHLPWATGASDVVGGEVIPLTKSSPHWSLLGRGILIRATQANVTLTWST
jgi:alpha-D-xyloside xylohydrolase